MKRDVQKYVQASLASMLMLVAGLASAQTTLPAIDTTDVTDWITTVLIVALAAIGGVWMLAAVVSGGWRWMRGAASGK